ncbi:aa3-type cytochrome c oxidase subunit IV [Hephaestia mangrovi]|nr:aa3-type cytochrome c oxidase subunit IV [Hephaestia mangrovi]MBY8829623.1 aa3-type cytochrome c oxidase subunit IV [Hephaestia mangrovi]
MAESGDMKAHEATYHSIMGLLKWGAVGCFFIAFFVIWLIS